ncbi:MAG: methyltransferase domain-containing protein [Methylotenera sp.]|nr:methyltransferase domain-containing protein [Methylotenera sp.]
MTASNGQLSGVLIEDWLAQLRLKILSSAPNLIEIFDLYASEAKFGRNYIATELDKLAPNAEVLEVGAGSLILSTQLVREGFKLTALEPTGSGFSHFNQLREIVISEARLSGCMPNLIEVSAESLDISNYFDFAFSVNVMEHVNDIELTLIKVMQSIKVGGEYKFTCPNYVFPYEPHFNIPTVISKSFTEKIFSKRIYSCKNILDPQGLWDSINWITVPKLRSFAKNNSVISLKLRTDLFNEMINRTIGDEEFSKRRSPFIKRLLSLVIKLKVNRVVQHIPAIFQPVIDCSFIKSEQ